MDESGSFQPPRLKIGAAATLTGVSPGRLRHYQRLGLLRPRLSPSGYRYFSASELVTILHIDLLRSLGMGLEEIRASLPGGSVGSLRQALERHRDALTAQRLRLDALIGAVQQALDSPDASPEQVAAFLASSHSTPGESLGIFGRLSRPLSEAAAARWEQILGGGWELPVPAIFGRMLLPPRVSETLEALALAPGNERLFARVRSLAEAIVGMVLGGGSEHGQARQLARSWVESFSTEPLPDPVQAALDATVPRIRELAVLNQGFQLWAEAISPQAASVLRLIQEEARARGYRVLGVLLAGPTAPQGRSPKLLP